MVDVGSNASTSRGDDRYILSQMFDTLVSMDGSGNFVPRLAESWEMREREMVMKLRSDVKFHDGTPFNAEAVKFVFDWYMTSARKPIFMSEISAIQSVDVLDPYTVRFNLKEPSAILLSALSNNAGMMMSPAAIKQYGDDIVLNPVVRPSLKEAIEGIMLHWFEKPIITLQVKMDCRCHILMKSSFE